jgi:thiol-disulfide isomerase/thioredoxin
MDQKIKKWGIIAVIIIVVVGLGYLWFVQVNKPGRLDDFAKCIKESGAKFYGAFWCPHCQDQKELFGSSKKHLPYVECSTPDSNSQLQVCKDAKVAAYPTWEFADGSRLEGEISLEKLAEKSGCMLPQ